VLYQKFNSFARPISPNWLSEVSIRITDWAIVDLIGKASHIPTIPMPDWVKDLVDDWLQSAGISNGKIAVIRQTVNVPVVSPPPRLAPLCSTGSQVLRHSPTSPVRARPPFGFWPSRTGLDLSTKT
jgi:hypothetical protein